MFILSILFGLIFLLHIYNTLERERESETWSSCSSSPLANNYDQKCIFWYRNNEYQVDVFRVNLGDWMGAKFSG